MDTEPVTVIEIDAVLSFQSRKDCVEVVRRLAGERDSLRAERVAAIAMAKDLCRGEDWWADWPDNLHMADVIEKRIFNMAK